MAHIKTISIPEEYSWMKKYGSGRFQLGILVLENLRKKRPKILAEVLLEIFDELTAFFWMKELGIISEKQFLDVVRGDSSYDPLDDRKNWDSRIEER